EAAGGVPGDDAVLSAVQNLAGEGVVVPPENYPPEVMQALIGASAAFLGSRMHSSVFAMQQGVPLVGIGYLPKTHGIMSMFGLGDFVCPIEEVSEDILHSMLVSAMSERERFLSAQASIRRQGGEARAKLIRALTGFVRQAAAA
ncbi:MAG: polysaccharide pyruvyl transferase family protein, partial [Bryobacteraceae bacterium]|nr:polysaccharide pyruvyl transferase family protein [Bryobacteraceae bacterium]